jgi:hypothetical protein
MQLPAIPDISFGQDCGLATPCQTIGHHAHEPDMPARFMIQCSEFHV